MKGGNGGARRADRVGSESRGVAGGAFCMVWVACFEVTTPEWVGGWVGGLLDACLCNNVRLR